jgi:thiol-disulfide isomerase/thioredoxin
MLLKSVVTATVITVVGSTTLATPTVAAFSLNGYSPRPQQVLLQPDQRFESPGWELRTLSNVAGLHSSTDGVAATTLAQHLKSIGAKMYGAFWCGFCKRQKQLFGNAVQQINYIECDSRGKNSQTRLCQQANITSFPTWEINGKLYPGLRTLPQLAALSGYKGL